MYFRPVAVKTQIFCHIAHGASTKGNRILILSHRIELIDQISDSLKSWDTLTASLRLAIQQRSFLA